MTTIMISVLMLALAVLVYDNIGYRKLVIKLTATLKSMYCIKLGCTNLKYYTTPDDKNKGMITQYCSTHLMERLEHEN